MKETINFTTNSQEKETEKKLITLKVLLTKLINAQHTIENAVVETLNVKDSELDALVEGVQKGKNIGQAAGQYFRDSAQNGLFEPEKEYIHNRRPGLDFRDYVENIKSDLLRYKIKKLPSVFDYIKKERLKEFTTEVDASLIEDEIDEDKLQIFTQVVKQKYSKNLIREVVASRIGEKNYYPICSLQISNPETKIAINITDLVPQTVRLVPSEIAENHDFKRLLGSPQLESIGQYKGTQNISNEQFSFVTKYAKDKEDKKIVVGKEIRYGDLTRPGGFLSLLHEIAHSWQAEYFEDYGKYPFEEWLSRVKELVSYHLQDSRGKITNDLDTWKYALNQMGVSFTNDENKDIERVGFVLKGLKAGTEREEFDENGQKFTKHSTLFTDQKLYSERLPQLMEDFVRSERIAWAHAIRVLRFLRDQGVDLEPTLKTEKDFRDYIHPMLETYNPVFKESGLEPPRKVRKFV